MDDADNMELIDQETAYQQVGTKIKEDLLTGNAVVLFAYGLSGSGKVLPKTMSLILVELDEPFLNRHIRYLVQMQLMHLKHGSSIKNLTSYGYCHLPTRFHFSD